MARAQGSPASLRPSRHPRRPARPVPVAPLSVDRRPGRGVASPAPRRQPRAIGASCPICSSGSAQTGASNAGQGTDSPARSAGTRFGSTSRRPCASIPACRLRRQAVVRRLRAAVRRPPSRSSNVGIASGGSRCGRSADRQLRVWVRWPTPRGIKGHPCRRSCPDDAVTGPTGRGPEDGRTGQGVAFVANAEPSPAGGRSPTTTVQVPVLGATRISALLRPTMHSPRGTVNPSGFADAPPPPPK